MDEIKIFVAHSPDSRDVCIRHPLFYHVAAGSSQIGRASCRERVSNCV